MMFVVHGYYLFLVLTKVIPDHHVYALNSSLVIKGRLRWYEFCLQL